MERELGAARKEVKLKPHAPPPPAPPSPSSPR